MVSTKQFEVSKNIDLVRGVAPEICGTNILITELCGRRGLLSDKYGGGAVFWTASSSLLPALPGGMKGALPHCLRRGALGVKYQIRAINWDMHLKSARLELLVRQ